ncbi:MAG: hypothetical protein K8L99_34865 [Anaerolineae bacterium]|nr:hypothetical protein [Anaerolineae bacterium]
MSVILAATYDPRGEINRLKRFYPQMQAAYSDILISLPPYASLEDIKAVQSLPGADAFVNEDWTHGRYQVLKRSLQKTGSHVHYADMDRLLRWIELRCEEWQQTVEAIGQADCLVIGRTKQAWETHPQSLRQTEHIPNTLFSDLLGQAVDLSSGSKGFSRAVVELLVRNTQVGRSLGTDAEWVILPQRAGYKLETLLVDGLDWETADRHRDQAADPATQRRLAAEYDMDPTNWALRVQVAQEIVEMGLLALKRPLAVP